MHPTLLALAFLLPPSGPAAAAAGDLRLELVPADARFLFHLDVEELRSTQLFGILERELGPDGPFEELETLERELGLHPLEDVLSVTAWGSGGEAKAEAAVVVTTPAVDTALERLREEHTPGSLSHDGVELTVFGGDEAVFVHVDELDGARRAVVLADSAGGAARAARVLHGDLESLAEAGDPGLRRRPAEGSFLFLTAAGGVPGLSEFEPASRVMGPAQGIRFDLGESGGLLFLALALETEAPDAALDVADAIQGLLALGRLTLAEAGADGVRDLLRGIRIERRDATVLVDLEIPSATLQAILSDGGPFSGERDGQRGH